MADLQETGESKQDAGLADESLYTVPEEGRFEEAMSGTVDGDVVEGDPEEAVSVSSPEILEGTEAVPESFDDDILVFNAYHCPKCGETVLALPAFPLLGCMFCCSSFEEPQLEPALLWASDVIVPFVVDKGLFFETVLQWMAAGDFTPNDIFRQVYLDLAEELYLPFYLFEGRYAADFTAAVGTEQPIAGTKEVTIDWQPTSGRLESRFAVLQYAGQRGLPPDVIEFLETMPIDEGMLESFESFTIGMSVFRPFDLESDSLYDGRTAKGLQKVIEADVLDQINTTHVDSLQVTPVVEKTVRSIYLPVWLLSYEYKEEIYYAAVDGILPRKRPKMPQIEVPRIYGTKPSDGYRELLVSSLDFPFKLSVGLVTVAALVLLVVLDLSGWWQFILILGYLVFVMGLYRKTERRRTAILTESREKRVVLLRHLKQKCVDILTTNWRAKWAQSMAVRANLDSRNRMSRMSREEDKGGDDKGDKEDDKADEPLSTPEAAES